MHGIFHILKQALTECWALSLINVHWGSTPVSLLIGHAVSIPRWKYAESVHGQCRMLVKSVYEVKRTSHVIPVVALVGGTVLGVVTLMNTLLE